MAILKMGTVVVGVRGTVGGLTFSANKAGPYCKSWARPANPATPSQSDYRRILNGLGALWRGMSQATRDGWDAWAALSQNTRTNSLGQTYNPSGWQMFVSNQTYLIYSGRSTSTSIPTDNSTAGPTLTSVTIRPRASGGSNFVIVAGEYGSAYRPFFYLRPFWSTAKLSAPNRYYLVSTTNPIPGTTVTITDEVEALFGDPVVGQKFFALLKRSRTSGWIDGTATTAVNVT